MFPKGLIDELSQHAAHPLRLHNTANFLFVQASPHAQLLQQWKRTAAPDLHMYNLNVANFISSYSICGLTWRLFISFHMDPLCCLHPESVGFQAAVHVSKASKCQCLDMGDVNDTFFLISSFARLSCTVSNHSANTV